MNLLITGAWREAREHFEEIEKLGHTVWFLPQEKDPLPVKASLIEGVIGNGLFLTHPIEEFDHLRYIQLTSAGYDRVPMDYIREKNIRVHNARGVYSAPMAEFAILGVLSLYKRCAFFYENKKRHLWEKDLRLKELSQKTVLILGSGSVGTACKKRFDAFECRVICLGRNEIHCTEKYLATADIVLMALPLTDETRHFMNETRFRMLKDGAVFINLSRGALVDEKVLAKELPRLGGVVLDVFEEEPLPKDSPFWDMENVILTPHNSFAGDGNAVRLWELIWGNLITHGNGTEHS